MRLRRSRRFDSGYSLIEVMVTMGVMSIVGAIFTASILQIYQTTVKTESISIVQSQLQRAYQRFDKELRYASWIAQPGKVGTVWYVEFAAPSRFPSASATSGGAANADDTQCGQLRFETALPADPDNEADGYGLLQLISWKPGTPPAPGATGQTVASQLLTPDAAGPFERQSAGISRTASDGPGTDFTPEFQRLRVRLTSRVGDSIAEVDTTFTALNTSRSTPDDNVCREGRPT